MEMTPLCMLCCYVKPITLKQVVDSIEIKRNDKAMKMVQKMFANFLPKLKEDFVDTKNRFTQLRNEFDRFQHEFIKFKADHLALKLKTALESETVAT